MTGVTLKHQLDAISALQPSLPDALIVLLLINLQVFIKTCIIFSIGLGVRPLFQSTHRRVYSFYKLHFAANIIEIRKYGHAEFSRSISAEESVRLWTCDF